MVADHLSRLRRHHHILHPLLLKLPPHIAQLIQLQHRRHLHHLRRLHHTVLHQVTKIGEVKDSQALMVKVLVGVEVVEAVAEEMQA